MSLAMGTGELVQALKDPEEFEGLIATARQQYAIINRLLFAHGLPTPKRSPDRSTICSATPIAKATTSPDLSIRCSKIRKKSSMAYGLDRARSFMGN